MVQVLAGENFAFPLDTPACADQPTHAAHRRGESEQSNGSGGGLRRSCFRLLKPRLRQRCWWTKLISSFTERRSSNITSVRQNLFVARTFSKAYGLAGLRIGILAGDAGQMAMVRRVASPYNVNAVALAALPEALQDQEYVEHYVAEVQSGRELFEQELRTLGLALLAEPRQLCARARRSRPRGIHSSFARAGNSGARQEFRSRDAKAACA